MGHASRNCHAFGTKDVATSFVNTSNCRQGKYQPSQQYYVKRGTELHRFEEKKDKRFEGDQGKHHESQTTILISKDSSPRQGEASNPSAKPSSPTIADFLNTEGFIKQGRRGKKGNQGGNLKGQLTRSNSADNTGLGLACYGVQEKQWGHTSTSTEHLRNRALGCREQPGNQDWSLQQYAKPSYFTE